MRIAIIGILAAFAVIPQSHAAETIKPGQWQITTTPQTIDMPGMPAGMASAMLGKPMTLSVCITPDDVKQGPRALFSASKGKCDYSKFDVAGGKIDLVAECKGGRGISIKTSSTGSFTPTSYDVASKSEMTGPHSMKSTARSSGKWVGSCKK